MMKYLNFLDFFSELTDTIIYSLIAVVVVICFILLMKSKETRKFLYYVIATLIIILGIYSSVGLIKNLTSESYVNGSLELKNSIGVSDFEYCTNSIVFIEENSTFICEKSLSKVEDFDGDSKDYNVIFNDYYLIDALVSGGAIYAEVSIDFYNPDGTITCNSLLTISVKFFTDRTSLILTTNSQTESNYLEKYFEDYGFKLEVNEKV